MVSDAPGDSAPPSVARPANGGVLASVSCATHLKITVGSCAEVTGQQQGQLCRRPAPVAATCFQARSRAGTRIAQTLVDG